MVPRRSRVQHTLSSDPTVTFTFGTPVSIGTIESIYGWQDNQSFSDQDFTITYTLGVSPTIHTLGSVAYNPFDPANGRERRAHRMRARLFSPMSG